MNGEWRGLLIALAFMGVPLFGVLAGLGLSALVTWIQGRRAR